MEEFIRQGIKKIGLWALVAVAVLAVIAVRFLGRDNTGDALNLFSHVYRTGECVSGQMPYEGAAVVRLEEDKTMLLRQPGGLWENLGVLTRAETEQGSVEAWKTKDGRYRILVMTEGVYLAEGDWMVWLSRVDTLSVGVNTGQGSEFLKPQWYPEGESVGQEQLSQCRVSGQVTLVLNLEEYQEELAVEVDGEELVLPRDRSRAFLLDLEGDAGEIRTIQVPYGDGAYRFALVFDTVS